MNLEQQQILLKQNKTLRLQLRQANIKIKALQEYIGTLQARLSANETEETTAFQDQSYRSDEEIFTQSSHSSQNQGDFDNEEQQKEQFSSNKKTQQISARVIFNYHSDGKQPPNFLQHKISCKQPSENEYNKQKSLKQKIHSEGQIFIQNDEKDKKDKNPKGLFHKIKSTKKIFQTFFVTGYSHNLEPQVQYFYPEESIHFSALIALIYNDTSLRPFESIHQMMKSPRYSKNIGKFVAKQTFVIPLRRGDSEQKQYLVACEVEDFIEGPDHSFYGYSRMFCFITVCNFFGAFKQILEQFIQKINSRKNKFFTFSPLSAKNIQSELKELLQEHLEILWVKSIEENQYANFGLGNQIKVFIDIPSVQNSYKTLIDFNSNDIFCIQISVNHNGKIIRSSLMGFLVIYLLTQAKILLYSTSKSKISEAILHLGQFIKPLEYVNPIIMAAIKEDHQQYLDAPISLVLGLWNEAKYKKKQKIQIFVNRKTSLSGVIQDCSLQIKDGVVFNLDTGRIFGGGLNQQKNQISLELNSLINQNCRGFDEKYKLFDKIFKNNFLNGHENNYFGSRLTNCIKHSQLYRFFVQKSTHIYK